MGIFGKKRGAAASAPKRPFTSAVIVAAGKSMRMLGEDKIRARLGASSVLLHSVLAFEACPLIDEIIIVTRPELIPEISDECAEAGVKKLKCVVRGGESRTDSVYRGLVCMSREAELAAIHDGARPLVSQRVIEGAVRLAAETGAAVPMIPLTDTIKRISGGRVVETPPRTDFGAVQTPQVFSAELITAATSQALKESANVTDDAAAVERLGMSVALSDGDPDNFKITNPGDIERAELILSKRGDLH